MRYQSFYKFYWLGTCLRYLQDAETNSSIHGSGFILDNLKEFFKHLQEIKLSITENLSHKKLDKLITELENTPVDANLTEEQASILKKAITQIRDTLESEIEGIGAYITTPKRLDLSRLLNDVNSLFAPNIFNDLPNIARFDFIEAGKCIAFELSTAAAFHILRGTEDTLKFYYKSMVHRKRIPSMMWGPIINDLRKKSLTKKYTILNNHLDNIRSSFRNPTQHPEATYDIHEVQDLWSICVDVVNRMIKILKTEKKFNRL